MDIMEIMKQRHSVRQYKDQAIEPEKKKEINACIKEINAKSGLDIQIFYNEPKCFDSFMAHYGKFSNVKNYIAIVGKKEDQEKAGYYGEKLVLKCQELGLNTCWVGSTFKKKPECYNLAPGEKVVAEVPPVMPFSAAHRTAS